METETLDETKIKQGRQGTIQKAGRPEADEPQGTRLYHPHIPRSLISKLASASSIPWLGGYLYYIATPCPSRPSSQHYGSSFSPSTSSDSNIASESASAAGYRPTMDSVQLPIASVEVLRCMRCARSVEATSTDDIGAMGMVRIAHNLYYCERCAKMVGYI
ncbi:hypothetical protein NW759_016473 [Fusarium solani]|nr:hypothetical protein NW759_016473 [Fusarium solani]